MTPKIRILRLIEYVYDTPEVMCRDMKQWTLQHSFGGVSMTSTVLPPDILSQPETTQEVKDDETPHRD